MNLRQKNIKGPVVRASVLVLIAFVLASCSSPEEKMAGYIENGNALFADGQLAKAEIEYKNALQVSQNQPDALFGLARIYELQKRWPETYAALNKIKELVPQHVDGRIMLAKILLASNQIDEARTDVKDIMRMVPDDPRAHSLMASVQTRLGDHDGALKAVDKALALEPVNSDAIIAKARVFINAKNHQAALDTLKKAIKKDPDNLSLYLMQLQAYEGLNDAGAVEHVLLTLIKRFPDESVYKSALSQQYLARGDIDAAERMLRQIVGSQPENIDHKLRLLVFTYQFRSTEAAIGLVTSFIKSSPETYQYRFLLAELFERSDQIAKAEDIYRQIIDDSGLGNEGLEARNKIAAIEISRGSRESAERLIEEVLRQDAANGNGLLLRAEMQIAGRDFENALINARTVLRDNPDSFRALELMGEAYDAMGSTSLALDSYRQAIQLNPGSPIVANRLARHLLFRGDYKSADNVLLESLGAGNRDLETIQLLIQVKLALGQWDQAEMLSKELQNVEGQQALSQHMLGMAFLGQDDRQASVEAFKRAHELAPSASEPMTALVQVYLDQEQPARARQFLQSVIEDDDDNFDANLMLARVLVLEKNYPGAIAQFDKAARIKPQAGIIYHELASLQINQKNLAAAEKAIKLGLTAVPDLPMLMIDLALIQQVQGKSNEAIETYTRLLEKHPDHLLAKNNFASLLTERGDDQKMLERARKIAADLKDSPIPQYRDTYAWALVQSGTNLDEAIAILEKIVDENQTVDVYSYHLGEAHRRKGNIDAAKNYLEKSLALARDGSSVTVLANESLKLITP